MTVVNQVGWVLQFTSEDLRRDMEIVMNVVRKKGGVIKFESGDLSIDTNENKAK